MYGSVLLYQTLALKGLEEVDRSKEDLEDQLETNGDLNGGSGLLVEPRERKKGEVINFAMLMRRPQ